MTCVIASMKLKLIAADSRESVNGVHYQVPKLFTYAGKAYGLAGDSWMGGQFETWVKSGFDDSKKPDWSGIKEDESFDALEISAAGIRRWDKHLASWPVSEPKWIGIGNGSDLAIGALEAGASIEDAFEIVFRRNGLCGPPIRTITLADIRKGVA